MSKEIEIYNLLKAEFTHRQNTINPPMIKPHTLINSKSNHCKECYFTLLRSIMALITENRVAIKSFIETTAKDCGYTLWNFSIMETKSLDEVIDTIKKEGATDVFTVDALTMCYMSACHSSDLLNYIAYLCLSFGYTKEGILKLMDKAKSSIMG